MDGRMGGWIWKDEWMVGFTEGRKDGRMHSREEERKIWPLYIKQSERKGS